MAIILEILDFSTLSLQLLWGVESNICLIGIKQLQHIFLINIATLALTIRAFVTTKAYTLVELNAKPFERLNDILLGSRNKTRGVGIFYTEYQVAAMLAGKQVIIECGTYAANM